MGIISKIKSIFKKKPQIGTPVYKFSEKAERTGGYVSTSDPSVPSTFKGYTPVRGGGGGAPAPTPTPTAPIPTPTAPTPTTGTFEVVQISKEEEEARAKEGEKITITELAPRQITRSWREEGREITKEKDSTEKEALTTQTSGLNLREGLGKFKDFFFGETGKKFVGVGGLGAPIGFVGSGMPIVTAEEIQTGIRERGGFPGRVVAPLIPTTPGEVALTGGAVALYPALPVVARAPIGGAIGYFEGRKVFDPTLTPEERVRGGLLGGLAITGVAGETLPFARGAVARISPKYKPVVKAEKGFEFIKFTDKDIGLIPPGRGARTIVDLPKTSPLRRGGFGVKPGEKTLFLSKDQLLATSQRDFFKTGKEISLEREFFVTPEEPFVKIAETRVSRLGLTDLFKSPRDIEIGFGLPPRPQIGIIRAGVGRRETATQFIIGKGTELEAIKTFGTIKDIKLIGKTTIKGQAVDIFEFSIGKGKPGLGKDILGKPFTTAKGEFVSGTGLLSTAGVSSIISAPPRPSPKPRSRAKPPFPISPTPAPYKPTKPSFPTMPFEKPSISYPKWKTPAFPTIPSYPIPRKDFFPSLPTAPKKRKQKYGVEDPFRSLRATRIFKRTPSLFDVTKFQMGYKVPKAPKSLAKTGLVGYGIGAKLPKIKLPSTLLGEIQRTTSRKSRKIIKRKKPYKRK